MSLTTQRIRELNDQARTTMGLGCRLVQTIGINALPAAVQSQIRERIETFTDFSSDNDPYGEHDFGALTVADFKCFWKIDYYDPTFTYHSDDPADPAKTRRVLTIMLASEY